MDSVEIYDPILTEDALKEAVKFISQETRWLVTYILSNLEEGREIRQKEFITSRRIGLKRNTIYKIFYDLKKGHVIKMIKRGIYEKL